MLTGDLIPESTADGSLTFFSEDFGEWFHSRAGALAEAEQTYVQASCLASKAVQDQVCILDVCYGLGYNTAAALETLWKLNPRCQVQLYALELDPRAPRQAIAHHCTLNWSPVVLNALASLATDARVTTSTLKAKLLLGDAREQIQAIAAQGWQADAIFLDPFSPPHCPELWTVDFLHQVGRCLGARGYLTTYSCAAAVRAGLRATGLHIGSTKASGRRWPGTIAALNPEGLSPLSRQEIEHLQTRAAVLYRDPSLNDAAETIRQRRQQEQAQSSLEPTSRWRRRWLS